MDDSELNSLADAFEASADVADAKFRLHRGKPYLWVTANRTACIRFAAAFLRAAASPAVDGNRRGKRNSIRHVQGKTDYAAGYIIQRMETWPEPQQYRKDQKRQAWRNDRIALVGCGVVASILLFLVFSGVCFWWSLCVNGK